jgi:hypothetical protein
MRGGFPPPSLKLGLIAVGTSDAVTIPAFAQALYQKANQPKQL